MDLEGVQTVTSNKGAGEYNTNPLGRFARYAYKTGLWGEVAEAILAGKTGPKAPVVGRSRVLRKMPKVVKRGEAYQVHKPDAITRRAKTPPQAPPQPRLGRVPDAQEEAERIIAEIMKRTQRPEYMRPDFLSRRVRSR